MNYRQWMQERRCFNCGSTKLTVRGEISALAKVRCGDCDIALITWRSIKKISREISIKHIR